jgi:hypothetical protein
MHNSSNKNNFYKKQYKIIWPSLYHKYNIAVFTFIFYCFFDYHSDDDIISEMQADAWRFE